MKYFSLAIVAAFLCAAVVSAAPSSPNPTFEELAFDPIHEINEKITEYAMDLQCIRDIITKELKKTDFAKRWDRLRDEFDRLFSEKWTKCNKKDFRDKMECRAKIIRQGAEYFKDFLRKMARDNKEMFMRIREKIMEKCMKRSSFLEEEMSTRTTLVDQFQCLVDVLAKVSKDNGLKDMWTKNKPQFQTHLDSWKRCAKEDNKIALILCNIREGVWTYKLMADYIRDMTAENPKTVKEFVRLVKKECQAKVEIEVEEEDEFGVLIEDESKDVAERIRCMIDAIRDAVAETDYAKMWEEMKQEMEDVGNRMKSCQTEQDKWETAKCIRKELDRAREIFTEFMRRMAKANRKTWERIRDNMKERCSA